MLQLRLPGRSLLYDQYNPNHCMLASSLSQISCMHHSRAGSFSSADVSTHSVADHADTLLCSIGNSRGRLLTQYRSTPTRKIYAGAQPEPCTQTRPGTAAGASIPYQQYRTSCPAFLMQNMTHQPTTIPSQSLQKCKLAKPCCILEQSLHETQMLTCQSSSNRTLPVSCT